MGVGGGVIDNYLFIIFLTISNQWKLRRLKHLRLQFDPETKNPPCLSSSFKALFLTRKSSVHSRRGHFPPPTLPPCFDLLTPTMPTGQKRQSLGSVLAYRVTQHPPPPPPQVWPAAVDRPPLNRKVCWCVLQNLRRYLRDYLSKAKVKHWLTF